MRREFQRGFSGLDGRVRLSALSIVFGPGNSSWSFQLVILVLGACVDYHQKFMTVLIYIVCFGLGI